MAGQKPRRWARGRLPGRWSTRPSHVGPCTPIFMNSSVVIAVLFCAAVGVALQILNQECLSASR